MTASERRPIPSVQCDPLPSLAEVTRAKESGGLPALAVVGAAGAALAAGVALVPPHAPVCGSTRADELSRHGPVIRSYLREGRVSDAVAELTLAMGLRAHPTDLVRAMGDIPAVGSVIPVPPTPPEAPTSPLHFGPAGGAAPPITVAPPDPPANRHHDRAGHHPQPAPSGETP